MCSRQFKRTMEENKNIEDSFKKRFESGEIRNEGWNDPSDKVWDSISEEIHKKEESRFG